jgi:two-component system CheB/CheR fusion protein
MPSPRIKTKPGKGSPSASSTDADTFPIVGVGASAGGLEAFRQFLSALPIDTGMGFVLVQHLDPVHESALASLLARATRMPVLEVSGETPVKPNRVYVIPPNRSLTISKSVLKLRRRDVSGNKGHRSVDVFLESLAHDQRERAIGVILSGTGTDGSLGVEAIKAEGGIAFAQDDSAKYDSMPRSAIAAGCVDFVLSPEKIAQELARIAKHPYLKGEDSLVEARGEAHRARATAHQDDRTPLRPGGKGKPDIGAEQPGREAKPGEESLKENRFKEVLLLLHKHSGVDFSFYKSTTIQRRITRRLMLSRKETLEEYAQYLRSNVRELDALYAC